MVDWKAESTKNLSMKSMTGYGFAKALKEKVSLEASIRAVNGRFLEVRFHLPKEYIPFESDLKKLLQNYFERGTIDVFVGRKESLEKSEKKVSLNKSLAKEYKKAYDELAKLLKAKPISHVEIIARHSEIFVTESSNHVDSKEKSVLLGVIEEAIVKCEQERAREGVAIRKDIEKHLKNLSTQIENLRDCREEVNSGLFEKVRQKVHSRLEGISVDDQRISQEIVMQLEKSDINEELQRLSEHLEHYKEIFKQKGGVGKKLDFYTQELLREVNTIGSKSNVSKLTTSVVEAKTIIEKLREQVQNIE